MKIALITDTHFGARNDNQIIESYMNKFYEEVFFPTLKERGIKTCIHLGDVVDRRKFISYRIAHDFRERFINKFQELGIDLHIIVGNHDTYYKNTNEIILIDTFTLKEYINSDRYYGGLFDNSLNYKEKIYFIPTILDIGFKNPISNKF